MTNQLEIMALNKQHASLCMRLGISKTPSQTNATLEHQEQEVKALMQKRPGTVYRVAKRIVDCLDTETGKQ